MDMLQTYVELAESDVSRVHQSNSLAHNVHLPGRRDRVVRSRQVVCERVIIITCAASVNAHGSNPGALGLPTEPNSTVVLPCPPAPSAE